MQAVYVGCVAVAAAAVLCAWAVPSHAHLTPAATLVGDADGFVFGGVRAIAVHDISGKTYALVANEFIAQVVDITNPAEPLPVATIPRESDGYSYQLASPDVAIHDISAKTYALVVRDGVVQIVDITNPAEPLPVAVLSHDADGLALMGQPKSVDTYDASGRAYAVVGGAYGEAVRIVDITNPADPVLVAPALDEDGSAYAMAPQAAHRMAVPANGARTYAESDGVSDIAIHDVANRTYAVVAGAGDDGVRIIDVTQPDSPFPVSALSDARGFIELDGGGEATITKTHGGTYVVVRVNYNVHVIGITDPESPIPVPISSVLAAEFYDLNWPNNAAIAQVSGMTYVVVSVDYNVHVIDITDPESPAPVASTAVSLDGLNETARPGGTATVQISGRTYAVAASNVGDGVYVIDVTDAASTATTDSITAAGRFTQLRGASGIATHDISDGTYAVVASRYDGGVQVIDITNPGNPLPASAIADNSRGFTRLGGASGIAVLTISNGTYAVVAGYEGVQVINITNPADPLPASAIADNADGFTRLGGASGIATYAISNGTYAVVAGYEGVQVIDITNPADPLPATWVRAGPAAGIHDVSGRAHLPVSGECRIGGVGTFDTARLAVAGCLHN